MRIKVTTPVGVYHGKLSNLKPDSDDHRHLVRLIKSTCENGGYFSFESDTGEVFLPKEMIQKSVTEILV